MYKLTPEKVSAMIAEEDAFGTLRSYTIEEVWSHLEAPEDCEDDGEAFALLMGVMYELRPVGEK
jgi:hypothetical protein